MFVLAIDTSSPAVTAGVVSLTPVPVSRTVGPATDESVPPTLVSERVPLAARGHGELLAPSIAQCLDDAGLVPTQLEAVVAGTGPGPFTGLRVGLVTAAAFADAVAVPAYGVCSLDALALACADEPALLVATDARRREVYWARYEHGVRIGEPQVGPPADVPVQGCTAVAGAGGALYAEVWPQLRRRPERYPSPLALVLLARERLIAGAVAGAAGARSAADPLTPLYLRRPDAVVPGAPKPVTR